MAEKTQQRTGATLIEVAISTVLVGVLLVAALDTVSSATRTHLTASTAAEAWALAELLAAEVLAMPYEDPDGVPVFGKESDEWTASTRAQLDDVDDYHLWTESPPRTHDGTPLDGYTGWTAQVLVYLAEAAPSDSGITNIGTDEGLKRVRFRITNHAGTVVDVDTLRTRYGAGSTAPALTLPQATTLSIDYAVGGTNQQTHGEQLLNEVVTP